MSKTVDEFFEELDGISGLEGIDSLAAILAMDEEDFSHLAPLIVEEMRKAFNSPVDRYQMGMQLGMSGMTHAQLIESLNKAFEEIENLDLTQGKKDFLKEIFTEVVNATESASSLSGKIFQIPIVLCNEEAHVPTYGTDGSAGADVYALEDYTIEAHETRLLPLGFKIRVPVGYEVQMRPRSGMSLKTKIRIANAPGTIDSDYRGEVGLIVDNIGDYPFFVTKGMRIAQMVLNEVPKMAFTIVSDLDATDRGSGGYGSTGK